MTLRMDGAIVLNTLY